jgi:hypothetical protein
MQQQEPPSPMWLFPIKLIQLASVDTITDWISLIFENKKNIILRTISPDAMHINLLNI